MKRGRDIGPDMRSLKSFVDGKGILGVRVHDIRNFQRETDLAGENPFDYLAFKTEREGVRLKVKFKGEWSYSSEFPDLAPWSAVAYDLGGRDHHTFSTIFAVYDWNGGRDGKLGQWIEKAAVEAGR